MSPSAIAEVHDFPVSTKSLNGTKALVSRPVINNGSIPVAGMKNSEFSLDRDLHKRFPIIVGAKGNELYTKDGRVIFDATSGAAVSCLGHGNERVNQAIKDQIDTGISYLCSTFFYSQTVDQLCEELMNGTGGKMSRAYLTGSGSIPALILMWKQAKFPRFRGNGGYSKAVSPILLRAR
jgi:hypothetical protein